MGRTSDADIRLMDAALDLIWEESYGAVSVDDICTRAGVKKGSFYHFFKTKAELAVAALERMWLTETKPQLDHDFSPSLNPLQRLAGNLERVYFYQIDVKKQHGKVLGCPVCSVGSEVSTQETDVGAKVCELFSRKQRYYESMIRDAIAEGSIPPCDAHEKASALAGLIEGLTTQSRILNDPEVLKNLPATALGFLGASQESIQATLSR